MLIAANGVELWVEEHGAPTGVPVLLLSGSDATTLRWPASLLEGLVAGGARVIAYDHRDSGASTKIDPDLPYRLDDLAADACALLDALGLTGAHLVGYSMGGAVAQVVALTAPARVRSLTLVSTTPGLGDERLPFAADWFVERMAERLFAPPPRTPDDRVAWIVELYRMLAGPRFGFDESHQRALAAAELARTWYPESGHGVAVGAAPSRLDELGAVTAPTLVVHGTADPVFALAHGEALAAAVAGAQLVVVEGLGHEVPAGFGAELAALVLAHIAASGAPASGEPASGEPASG
jgi:pimeloyl-ACP methyl ester carboxylesterase